MSPPIQRNTENGSYYRKRGRHAALNDMHVGSYLRSPCPYGEGSPAANFWYEGYDREWTDMNEAVMGGVVE